MSQKVIHFQRVQLKWKMSFVNVVEGLLFSSYEACEEQSAGENSLGDGCYERSQAELCGVPWQALGAQQEEAAARPCSDTREPGFLNTDTQLKPVLSRKQSQSKK